MDKQRIILLPIKREFSLDDLQGLILLQRVLHLKIVTGYMRAAY